MKWRLKGLGLVLFYFLSCHFANGQVLENYNPRISMGKKHDLYHVFDQAKVNIDLEKFPKSSFEFHFPGEAAVFLEGRLWFFTSQDTSFRIGMREIQGQFSSGTKELLIFKEGIQKEDISVQKGLFDHEVSAYSENFTSRTGVREKDAMGEFFIVALIIILTLLALFKVTYPVIYNSTLNPVSVFSSDDFTEYNLFGKVFSSDILFQMLIVSMLVVLFLMTGAYYGNSYFSEYFGYKELNDLLFIWLLGVVVFMVLSLLKYLWIKISINIYQLEKHELSQFLYVMRIFLWVLLGIFGVMVVTMVHSETKMAIWVDYVVIGFFIVYLLSIIRLFSLMMRRVSFKKYHLFSYLCTSELVPFLVIVKLIMG